MPSQAQVIPSGPFVPVDDKWVISNKTIVGAKSRVESRDQHPYPFCFSYAAAILFDQHRCMAQGKDCATQPRSSALAITSAGQSLSAGEINPSNGGVGSYSLKSLVENGNVLDSVCNYNIHDPSNPQYQTNLSTQLSSTSALLSYQKFWKKYRDYTPYLERYYRNQFLIAVRQINPNISEVETLDILKNSQTNNQLVGSVLLRPACFKNEKISNEYTIKTLIVESEKQVRSTFEIINKHLDRNIPIFVGLCNGSITNGVCSAAMHAAVIIARGYAYSKITGDKRTVYWIVNTWGEHWQEKNADGWVFADNLLASIQGELVWLEDKK